MYTNKKLFRNTVMIWAGIAFTIMILFTSSNVYAHEYAPPVEDRACLNCHENLYFQHDTGNWFCLREVPMECVDCHGGNPSALIMSDAHADRKAHPIVSDDISKCQDCHQDECWDHVEKFDQVAGISDVLVVAPYQPDFKYEEVPLPVQESKQALHPVWLLYVGVAALVLVAGYLVTYFV